MKRRPQLTKIELPLIMIGLPLAGLVLMLLAAAGPAVAQVAAPGSTVPPPANLKEQPMTSGHSSASSSAVAPSSPSARNGPAGPRKVIIGSAMYGMWGEYPGLEKRLAQLSELIDEMAKKSAALYPERTIAGAAGTPGVGRLDLVVLPEEAVTAGRQGKAAERCVPLQGVVLEKMAAKARQYQTYITVPLDLVDDAAKGLYSNAVVLLDRQGQVVGTYRKVHAVAGASNTETEGGMRPGSDFTVFDCDFGRLGMAICFDMNYDDIWSAFQRQGAEIVAWPSMSPQLVQPAARALTHGYYLVSSTWRNNASIFDPTGAVVAQITKPEERVLVQEIDLSYALLPWSSTLRNGLIFDEKFGRRAGYRYSESEDGGIFWSNDPALPIGEMVRQLGLETVQQDRDRQRQVQDKVRGGLPNAK